MADEKSIALKDQGVTALAAPWDPQNIQIWSTLDPMEAISAKVSATPLEEMTNKSFNLVHVTSHAVRMVDEDGVITDVLRTIFTDDKGNNYGCVSKGALGSLQDLVFSSGRKPPWNPPIKVLLKIGKTRKGFRVFNLIQVK